MCRPGSHHLCFRERNALSAVSQLDDLGNAVSIKSFTYAGPQPHGASTLLDAGVTSTLDYDEGTGELFSRTVAGVSTTHDWDNLGQLEKTTTGSAASVNIYDAAGNRVLHRAAGVTTLSMGGQEISVADANPTAFSKEVRSYDLAGTPVAAKIAVNGAAAKLFWTFNDRQNSAEVAVDDAGSRTTPSPPPTSEWRLRALLPVPSSGEL